MPDSITELVRLRATMVRLAAEVEGMCDYTRISSVRAMAPRLAERMRDAALSHAAVEACRRQPLPPPPGEERDG